MNHRIKFQKAFNTEYYGRTNQFSETQYLQYLSIMCIRSQPTMFIDTIKFYSIEKIIEKTFELCVTLLKRMKFFCLDCFSNNQFYQVIYD